MEQLSEFDFSLLQMETDRTPNHISVAMLFEPPASKITITPEDIKSAFERKLHTSPVFRRKLTGDTGGFDTPYWIEDSRFDIDNHLSSHVLPSPGSWQQLCDKVNEFHGQPLDLSRPPWHAYLIGGLNKIDDLPPNSFALLLKVHHAAADGVAVMSMMTGLLSDSPGEKPVEILDDWEGEEEPQAMLVWSNAIKNSLRRPAKLANTLRSLRSRKESKSKPEGSSRLKDGFKTHFNQRLAGEQILDAIILDLGQVKSIRQSTGATVNDIIVSVVGGALRKYLQSKNELPEQSLVASVPVSVRAASDDGTRGNQIGMIWVKMGTHEEDPLTRLQHVSASTSHSKQASSELGADFIKELTEGLWPPLVGGFFKVASYAAGTMDIPVPQHTVVSNVPGPREPHYLVGARLKTLFTFSQLTDGMGLQHAVMSTFSNISISFLSCSGLMPDPDYYRECLQDSWQKLLSATTRQVKPT